MDKKQKALLIGGIVAVAAFGAGVAVPPQEVVKVVTKEVVKTVEVAGPIIEVEKEVFVDKIVEVESANLPLLLETLYDFDGNVQFLTEDLDDDELDEVVTRLVAVQDAKALAFAQIKRDATDELDGIIVNTTTLYEEDIRSLSILDDEWAVDSVDYEDDEFELSVPIRFKQGAEHFEAVLQVSVKDGDAKDIDILSVELRE
jgi:hypothetical protein